LHHVLLLSGSLGFRGDQHLFFVTNRARLLRLLRLHLSLRLWTRRSAVEDGFSHLSRPHYEVLEAIVEILDASRK
jgi:hypothetical protein